MNNKPRQCACCETYTNVEESDICPVCFWQCDSVAEKEQDVVIGSNKVSLELARVNYHNIGACEERFVAKVRKPNPEEINPSPN